MSFNTFLFSQPFLWVFASLYNFDPATRYRDGLQEAQCIARDKRYFLLLAGI